jgi:hypothetical protein
VADDQIDVRLGATDDGLKAGLQSAASTTESSTGQMQAAFAEMAASVQSVMQKLDGVLDRHLGHTKQVVRQEEEELSGLQGFLARVKEGFVQTQEQMEGFASRIGGVQKMLGLFAEVAAFGFIGEQVADLAREFAEWGDQMEKTTAQTGLTAQAVQELQFAGKNAGLSAQDMDMAMVRLSRTMAMAKEGNQQAKDTFSALGLSVADLNGPLDEVLGKIANSFKEHADGANKAALAQQAFGRAGFEMIAFLDKGQEGIEELRKRAESLGIVLGQDDVEAAARLHESFVEMDAQMQTVKLRAGEELAPAFVQIASAMGEISQKGGVLETLFQGLAMALKAVISVAISFIGVLEEIGIAIGTVAAAAITAATGHFAMAWDVMKSGLDDVKRKAEETDAALRRLWTTKQEEPKGAGEGEGGKKEDFTLPDRTKAADAQKLAEAQRHLSQAEQKAQLDMDKEFLAEGRAQYEQAYKDGLIDTKQYYDALLAITQEGLRGQIAAKQKDVDQARQVLAAAQATSKVNGEAAVVEARAKLVAVTGELNVLEQQLAVSATENAAKRVEAERKVAEQLATTNIEAGQKVSQQRVAQEQALAQERFALGQITKVQLAQLEQQLQDETYDIDRKALQQKLALYQQDQYKNPQKVAEVNAQLEELEAQHQTKMTELAAKEAEDEMANAKAATDGIEKSFEQAFASFADRTKTAKQAFFDFLTSIDQQLVQLVSKDLFNKLFQTDLGLPGGGGSLSGGLTSLMTGLFGGPKGTIGAATGKGAEQTAHTAALAQDTTGLSTMTSAVMTCTEALAQFTAALATGGGSQGGGALGSILGALGSSGTEAGAFGFTATGATGSAGAVAAGVDTSSTGGSMSALMGLASFDQGTPYVPQDMIAQIHQGEAVVPAHLNSPFAPGSVMVTNQFLLPGGVDLRTQSQVAVLAGTAIQQALRRNG